MEQKILEGLKKSYSNLGLSDKVFESQAKLLAVLAGEVSEEEQDARVAALVAGAKEMLTSVQSFGDSRAAKRNKGDEPVKTDPEPQKPEEVSGSNAELVTLLKQMNENLKASNDRIAALEGAKKAQTRDELIKGIAKELGLTGKPLDYAKALLSDEMDETAIRNSLGKSKKDFVKMGLHTDNDDPQTQATKDEAIRSEEEKWVEQFKAQQDAANK